MPAIPTDALTNVRWPTSLVEWQGLLGGVFPAPVSSWGFQDAGPGSITDQVGSTPLTADGGVLYRQFAYGWARTCARMGAANTISGTGANISTTSQLLVAMFRFDTLPASNTDLMTVGLVGDPNKVSLLATGALQLTDKGVSAAGSAVVVGSSVVLALKIDRSIPRMVLYVDSLETLRPSWTNPSSSNAFSFGGGSSSWPTGAGILASALWTGASAEQSDSAVATLISLIKTGHT